MRSLRRVGSASVVALALVATTTLSADSGQKAFEKRWSGRHVVVRRPLYSLVYKERSLRGSTQTARDGLTVITPFAGTYFQFDGRHRVDDIVERDVQRIIGAVTLAYQKSKLLDEGFTQVIEPVLLARYDPGTELVVSAARVNRDRVRLELSQPREGDQSLVTSLTVQWPAPLSKPLSERHDIEDLIRQFLTTPE